MGITIQTIPTSMQTTQTPMSETVDAFVDAKLIYDSGIKSLESVKKTMETQKKKLVAYGDANYTKIESAVLEGEEHSVEVSPKYKEAELASNVDILAAIGTENFLRCVKVSVTELKKYMSPSELEDILAYDNTGTRRVKVQK